MRNSELLHFYRGHPLTVYHMPDPESSEMEKVVLGPDPGKGQRYFYHVPRDRWFVRRLESDNASDFALIGCSVVPGYSDEDIETMTYGEIVDGLK